MVERGKNQNWGGQGGSILEGRSRVLVLDARNQNIIFQTILKGDEKLGGIRRDVDLFKNRIVTQKQFCSIMNIQRINALTMHHLLLYGPFLLTFKDMYCTVWTEI